MFGGDELYFSFEDVNSPRGGREGERGRHGQGERRGRGGRGRPRGPRNGRGREGGAGERMDDGSNLRRYSSTDSLNRGRGRGPRDNRGSRGRGSRGDNHARGRRDHSADAFGGYRDSSGRGWRGGRGGRGGGRGGERGGGGGGRGEETSVARRINAEGGRRQRNFPIRDIAAMEDVDETTMRLNSQIEDFTSFMHQERMITDDITKTLKVLSRVLQNDLQREIVLKILQIVCTSRFLDHHLTVLIQDLSAHAEVGSALVVVEVVEGIHLLLSRVLLKLPSYTSKGTLLLCALISSQDVISVLQQHKPSLVEDLKQLRKDCQEAMKIFQAIGGERKERRVRDRRGPNEDDDVPPDDFSQLPIFPNLQDMDWNQNIFLRANKEEGSYRDVNHYLDVQFRLLREDYIRPLRSGIKDFKDLRNKGQGSRKNRDLRLYHKVQILSMLCKESLEHRLQFEMTPQLKRVRWQSSKRLLFGSLVCLSMDDFDSVFFAVVTNRDAKDLEKGIINVRFEGDLADVLELSAKDVFIMAETTAYFEAYRHVLEGLQEMKDSLPMSRYLVDCSSTIKPPKYLLTGGKMGKMNLNALLKDTSGADASSVVVINPQRWPGVDDTTLNESQLKAVQTALSKELAIIQGPPGTGKTYVGLKVAKVLLENRNVWTDPAVGEKPILVVCYTNHALDQFLEGILSFCPEGIVRVGSRCKTPQLEEFNLKNIRRQVRVEKKVSKSVHFSIKDCVRKMNSVKEDIDIVSSRLEATNKGVVGARVLESHMPPGQYASLLAHLPDSSSQGAVMMQWLSKGAIVYQKGDDDEDPYPMLAAEVTSKILQGESICQETFIDPKHVHFLSVTIRAQLYRLWLGKVKAALQQEVTSSSAGQGYSAQESLHLQETAKSHILPDAILKPVMDSEIFSSITQPLKKQHSKQTNFYVRAWLGVYATDPQEVVDRIIYGREFCSELQFHPDKMMSIPRKARIHMYRFWLRKTVKFLNGDQNKRQKSAKHLLAKAKKTILPDHVLKGAMSPDHFRAIQKGMMACHQTQAQYFVRSWLGVQDFCQNAVQLEQVLDILEEETDNMKVEEAEENAEEEADVIQSSRHLDLDDDDDLFEFGSQKSRPDVRSAMEELGVQTTSDGLSASFAATDEEGFSVPKYHQKKQLRKIKELMRNSSPMAEDEASKITNIWSDRLTVEDRVRLYLFWLRGYQDELRQSVKKQAGEYISGAKELKELRMGEDKDILEEATIIGMTTTGAARYRRVLTGVACPIVILEEAAEVLEAHVVTTLHQTCQHLILIGDHQQLRPSPTVYDLSLHFKLDLSLFERLVKNDLHHSTLAVQHRMRPEVARLVRHVYPELRDHGTTLNRPHIRGMKHDVFLFHHEMEETHSDETSSKSNQYEAELCVKLCRYLLLQGYSSDAITILTAYSGQVFTLKTIMKADQKFYAGVRVTAVDNYQGEENDIIILSLVRSNQEGSVGFLSTDNRVCVALSRARNGFFAFGNFKILAESSPLWKNICRTAKEHGQLSDTLLLRCENHLSPEVKINTAKDFDQMPEGGCKLPCDFRLPCGHVCELSCHGYDRDHENYMCRKKCERITCIHGHPCLKKCYEDCKPCLFTVTKTVPMCGHQAEMMCHRDPIIWTCKDQCQGKLGCGHPCTGVCSDCRKNKSHVSKCTKEVERVWPCGHLIKAACHLTPEEHPCPKPCEATLSCSHRCQGTCGRCWSGQVHEPCTKKCQQVLAGCGHQCLLPCGATCLPCKQKHYSTGCSHSKCNHTCGSPCQPCMEECPWKSCRHQKCSSRCHDPCSPCEQPCSEKPLSCSTKKHPHPCSGLCGEKCFCFSCEKKNFSPLVIAGVESEEDSVMVDEGTALIKLPECGHIFKVAVLDVYMKKKSESLSAGCVVSCPVPTCKKRILDTDCWRYHGLFRERHLRFQKIKEDLLKETTISQERRQKLLHSLDMLTFDAEGHQSFASKAQRDHVFRPKGIIDVNKAMALTNQIKMTRVLETCASVLKNTWGDKHTERDLTKLQNLLYRPTICMPPQRLQDLSAATRRCAYMTKLACAVQYTSHSDFKERIQSALKGLKENGEKASEEAEAVLQDCKKYCQAMWSVRTKCIDVSILDQPFDMDLCDIEKPSPRHRSPPLVRRGSESETSLSKTRLRLRLLSPASSEEREPSGAFGTQFCASGASAASQRRGSLEGMASRSSEEDDWQDCE